MYSGWRYWIVSGLRAASVCCRVLQWRQPGLACLQASTRSVCCKTDTQSCSSSSGIADVWLGQGDTVWTDSRQTLRIIPVRPHTRWAIDSPTCGLCVLMCYMCYPCHSDEIVAVMRISLQHQTIVPSSSPAKMVRLRGKQQCLRNTTCLLIHYVSPCHLPRPLDSPTSRAV